MWKLTEFHWFAIAFVYVAFFGLIGVAIYLTKSASPLWALLLMPSFEHNQKKSDEDIKAIE